MIIRYVHVQLYSIDHIPVTQSSLVPEKEEGISIGWRRPVSDDALPLHGWLVPRSARNVASSPVSRAVVCRWSAARELLSREWGLRTFPRQSSPTVLHMNQPYQKPAATLSRWSLVPVSC
jgi:hypothetical protein